ncbi:GNAT family N-acetyltransferase [Bacillus horti]|uniref:Acetyltransferase n=1 Tax=Caldalkalibacillus horti TaxID=77523 RepID=A0ABT9VY01_9BACI|nr:GNAT family N-acetyltransferase [Bacillus horti]MDQ0165692.1 putative acetyltransferase [Bacillus horti]
MEIRQLTASEVELHIQLSEFAFQYELSKEDREVAIKRVRPDEIWGAFIDGKLASKLALLPLETYIHGKAYAMGGIAAVATWPEYRRQGLVAKLLTKALEVMKDNGQTISFLAPFSYPFYRRYGWEMHGEETEVKIKTKQFPKLKGQGHMERVGRDSTVIGEIYDTFAQKFNGALKRSELWWETRVFNPSKKGLVAVYRNAEGESKGYLYYQVKDRKLTIREMVYLDQDSYKGLWEFIAQHDSMIEEASFIAHPGDPLMQLVDDPNFEQKTSPYFMARIVDVAAFLEEYPLQWKGVEGEQTFIHVRDQYAPWNDGTFLIQPNPEGAKSEGDKSEPESDRAVNRVSFFPRKSEEVSCTTVPKKGLSCDIQTLSMLLINYKRPTELAKIERLHGEQKEIKKWEDLLPKERSTNLMDFF